MSTENGKNEQLKRVSLMREIFPSISEGQGLLLDNYLQDKVEKMWQDSKTSLPEVHGVPATQVDALLLMYLKSNIDYAFQEGTPSV